MRINIYSQELTKEVSLVSKTDERGNTHYGVRFWLRSPDCLHNTPNDDDRSAVTFWVPNCGSFTPMDLAQVFSRATEALINAAPVIMAQRKPSGG